MPEIGTLHVEVGAETIHMARAMEALSRAARALDRTMRGLGRRTLFYDWDGHDFGWPSLRWRGRALIPAATTIREELGQ